MQRIVVENFDELQNACVELVTQANKNGGEDNITVIVAKVTGEGLPEGEGDEVKLEILEFSDLHETADPNLDDVDTAENLDITETADTSDK